jgi:hypothetical protein
MISSASAQDASVRSNDGRPIVGMMMLSFTMTLYCR